MSLFQGCLIQATDNNGNPISGARWEFYRTGGTTPLNVYSNGTLATSLGSTVTADSTGTFDQIYLDDSETYRAILKTPGGATIRGLDIDPVNGASASSFEEQVRDIIAATLVAGENVNVDPNDTANTVTISAPLGGIQSLAPVKTGVFFDTAAGDTFTGAKFSAASDAALTVNPTSLVFSSATAKSLNNFVKDSGGNLLLNCFDSFDIEATYTVTSFPSAGIEGVLTGTYRDMSGTVEYGAMLGAGGAGAGYALAQIYNAGSALSTGTQFAFGAPIEVDVKYSVRGTSVTVTTSYPATADEVLTLTQVYTATSYETPRLFAKLGLQFNQGVITCTALKVSAQYPNATYALVGDSLTQGRFASVQANTFAAKLRAAYPDEVIIAGAPSATTDDWLDATQPIIDMGPRYAFVLLGVNDILLARSLANIQADYETIMDRFTAAGITPIAVSVPPINSSQVPTLNAWIASQGWLYVDIYSLLVGTGYALNATYDYGDTVHWNDAGHNVVYGALNSAISSLGLTVPQNAFFVDADPLMAADSDSRVPTQAAVVDYVAAQRSGTSALGYGTGAGGTVTQATSKSTGVTLNKLSGQITMNNAALGGNTAVTFTLTNSEIAASDTITVSIKSGATAASYIPSVDAVGAGSCSITLRNVTGGSLSEAVVLNFNVIKGATA